MAQTTMTRENILAALHRWVAQRPGLEFGNYGDSVAYRSELRGITRDCTEARRLLGYIGRTSISADAIVEAARGAYSGRLTLTPSGADGTGCTVNYCTGQYWPTEYRRAVCAVAASAIWAYWRDECMPGGELMHNSETGETLTRYRGMRAGDYLSKLGRDEFGRGMGRRWFN